MTLASSVTSVPPNSFSAFLANAASISFLYSFSIFFLSSSASDTSATVILGLPTAFTRSLMRSMSSPFTFFASRTAPATIPSGVSQNPPSSMTTLSRLEDTTKSNSLVSCSRMVGLIRYAPLSDAASLIYPTRTPAIGPFHGIGEMAIAAEVATNPNTSGSFSPSTESTVIITCTSCLYAFGNNGRIDRSITRPASTASSVGLPSRFTQRDPLIRPPAYSRSTYSTESGK